MLLDLWPLLDATADGSTSRSGYFGLYPLGRSLREPNKRREKRHPPFELPVHMDLEPDDLDRVEIMLTRMRRRRQLEDELLVVGVL